MPAHQTVADAVARALSLEILEGRLAPGSRLPSVRALADEHGVNVSTIQRALTRLQEHRLVFAHDRSYAIEQFRMNGTRDKDGQ